MQMSTQNCFVGTLTAPSATETLEHGTAARAQNHCPSRRDRRSSMPFWGAQLPVGTRYRLCLTEICQLSPSVGFSPH